MGLSGLLSASLDVQSWPGIVSNARLDDCCEPRNWHWVYLYRAIGQYGQVIDVLVRRNRDLVATRRFFTRALNHGP